METSLSANRLSDGGPINAVSQAPSSLSSGLIVSPIPSVHYPPQRTSPPVYRVRVVRLREARQVNPLKSKMDISQTTVMCIELPV
jgi:hypothetical protein